MTESSAPTTVVTGAAGRIGSAICSLLERRGHHVAPLDISATDTSIIACDLSDEDAVESTFRELASTYGTPSSLICATGTVKESALTDTTLTDWISVMDASLTAAFLTCRAFIKNSSRPASIVAFSSGYARKGYARGASYAAAKGGIESLIKSIALEYAADGVRANALAPGPVDTAMLDHVKVQPGRMAALESAIPLGRVGTAEEVASAAAFLLEDQSSYITGQVLHVNGGLLMP
ncbi:MAG: SDR family oxidoreductase [Halieaceae bacterium]|nr:SDR family oxidoreductase [Halieaceae bacterium]